MFVSSIGSNSLLISSGHPSLTKLRTLLNTTSCLVAVAICSVVTGRAWIYSIVNMLSVDAGCRVPSGRRDRLSALAWAAVGRNSIE